MKKFIKGLPYWINLYFFRHYKTTIPGVVSVAGGLSTIFYGAFPWKGKESFDLLTAGGAAVATGLGLIAAKDAGQTDAPQADPVTVRTVEGNLAEVKVADGEEPKP